MLGPLRTGSSVLLLHPSLAAARREVELAGVGREGEADVSARAGQALPAFNAPRPPAALRSPALPRRMAFNAGDPGEFQCISRGRRLVAPREDTRPPHSPLT